MKKGIILARVSTPEQTKGMSIDEIQLPYLRDYAKKQGIEIVKEFTFQETASQKLRKEFNKMVSYFKAEKNVVALIGYRVDRLTRNFRDAVTLDSLRLEHGKELHFAKNNLVIDKKSYGEAIAVWDNNVYTAKQHITRCQEHAYDSHISKFKAGKISSKAPYGYENYTKENGQKSVRPLPFESQIVRQVFDLYTTGAHSYLAIAHKISEDYNLKFPRSKVEKIIRRKFYAGYLQRDGEERAHIYETIISLEVFEMAQEIRTGRKRKKEKGKLHGKHGLYRGLLKCDKCGCAFTPSPRKKVQKNGNINKWVYYYCTNGKGKHDQRPAGIEEKELTKRFAQIFKKMKVPKADLEWMTKRLKDSHAGKILFNKEMFDTYTREIAKRDTRLENLYDDKLDGSITQEEYNKRRQRYQKEKDDYTQKLSRLNKADEEYYIHSTMLLELASRSYEIFMGSEPEQKREIIQLTLRNLRMKDGKLIYDWQKPFDSIFESSKSLTWGD